MSICKDCIHYEICDKYAPNEILSKVKRCKCFKAKADMVEVVRCKDCIHWGGVIFGFVCHKFSGIDNKICMGADRYCCYGERSENET